MMMLLILALMILDIMIVGVLLVKAIQSIFRSKSIIGALFWLVILAVILVYAIAFFNVAMKMVLQVKEQNYVHSNL